MVNQANASGSEERGIVLDGAKGGTFVVYDADWQTPAITELHAYRMALDALPSAPGVAYLAFPWASLIDQIHSSGDSRLLQAALDDVAKLTHRYAKVVTVCQHVALGRFAHLFETAGVTDIFWAHAGTPLAAGTFGATTIRPFPLYPVNSPGPSATVTKRHLFSFVGARPNAYYLDQTRTHILEELGGAPGGLVVARDDWHFFSAVYHIQIEKRDIVIEDPLANAPAIEYRQALAESLFVLCPSGSGPNTLRLWEAIDCGAIPVIISPLFEPPGSARLWTIGTLNCDNSRESIRQLPARLMRIAADTAQIERMRGALAELRARYGHGSFVSDITDFFRQAAAG